MCPGVEAFIVRVSKPAYACFTEVIEACPDKVANNIGKIFSCSPVFESLKRERLSAYDYPFRQSFMIGNILINGIIVTSNIELCKVRVLVVSQAVYGGCYH